ncbi:MAG: DinB family protein [Terriglobales bacterium]
MSPKESLLVVLQRENAVTRRVLERAPEGKFAWQPHPKSMSLGRLATHIAELAGFGAMVLRLPELEISARDYKPRIAASQRELLDLFDGECRKTSTALAAASDAALEQVWTLRDGEKVIFQMPRLAALRAIALRHTIHHRGQLTVYLRLNDVPVPSIYGPTADEPVQTLQ